MNNSKKIQLWRNIFAPLGRLKSELVERAEQVYGTAAEETEEGYITENPHRELRNGREIILSHTLLKPTVLQPIRSFLILRPVDMNYKSEEHLARLSNDFQAAGLRRSIRLARLSSRATIELITRQEHTVVPNEFFGLIGDVMLRQFPELSAIRVSIGPGLPERNALDGARITRNGFEPPLDPAQAT